MVLEVSGSFFTQLGIIIIVVAILAYLLQLLKQPQLLAYILVGVLITPILQLVTNNTIIETISTIGVAFLLFIVGLEMDIKSLKNVAFVTTVGGSIQIAILFCIGYIAALFLGYLSLEAAYIGLMITFSSTMIVMKLLSDKRELNTLHGRMIIGILLLEDIVAIFALSILTSLNSFSIALLIIALLKFLSLFTIAYLASRHIFPQIFSFAAKNQELLLICSLAVCFLFSITFAFLGFSLAIGAFIAGITLGNLDYNIEIIGKIKSLKDFFAMLFFVSLGMGLSLAILKKVLLPLIILLLIILVIKPFIAMFICTLFKYTKKPSFLTAISLTQMGEFSLIIAAQGLMLGHISQDTFSLIVLTLLFSIIFSSYFIKYSDNLYTFLQKPLHLFDYFTTERLEYLPTEIKPKIILCGHNRIGYSILRDLKDIKNRVLVIDYNPEIINTMVKHGYHCIYGEVTDDEIIERMHLEQIQILISTVPNLSDNIHLIRRVRALNSRAKILVTASDIDDSLKLYTQGADYVILPHFLGGEHVSNIVSGIRHKQIDLKDERQRHIAHLHERRKMGHDHPKN
ncbi:MAG: hypothetical protein A3D39_03885 [Candidatus Buchananbacteria bacterium RIFCSPHIGHO2_02_FULL_39_17]|nr:MAG: hypothetical protein A3D39_03885 [Candidatus Buchananbacteria bacterium RIFCSPHIGHO2_02_FULL_39_17]